jgi:hypothetical protein
MYWGQAFCLSNLNSKAEFKRTVFRMIEVLGQLKKEAHKCIIYFLSHQPYKFLQQLEIIFAWGLHDAFWK